MALDLRYPKGVLNLILPTFQCVPRLHGDRIMTFDRLGGVTATLPKATGSGMKYTFIIKTAATSNANVIQVGHSNDVMDGSINIQQDYGTDGNVKVWLAETGDDTMTFAGAATTGGIAGNRIECIDYAVGFWSCVAFTLSDGGSEASPFSAAV